MLGNAPDEDACHQSVQVAKVKRASRRTSSTELIKDAVHAAGAALHRLGLKPSDQVVSRKCPDSIDYVTRGQ